MDQMRAGALAAARETWATARTICDGARSFGVHVTKVMISRWYRDGLLRSRHSEGGRALEFHVGQVLDLARRHAERVSGRDTA